MKIKIKRKQLVNICLVLVLTTLLLLQLSSFSVVKTQATTDIHETGNKIQYWTEEVIVSDANISALSSSGTGTEGDPYIIDNLHIDTTDGRAIRFDGVSLSTYWELRDSYFKGSTYGVYLSDSTSGKATIKNCTIEGDLTIGTPNANYVTIENCTLISIQGSGFRQGITFTNNIVISTSPYSQHMGRFREQDNIITDNVFYGNNSEIKLQGIYDSTIQNNVLHSAGFSIDNGVIAETTSNTIEDNTVDGKPYGFFYNKTGEVIDGDIYGQIYLFNSVNSEIRNHNLSGSKYGIQIHQCSDAVVDNVTISGNSGIEVRESDSVLIEQSVLEGYNIGLNLDMVNMVVLQNNRLSGFAYGIDAFEVNYFHILNNTLIENEENGIYLDDCDNIKIKFNIVTMIVETPGSDLAVNFWICENVTIYYNVFINLENNTESPVQGGSSTNVIWYDETLEVGNHYSDWVGTGNYSIPGDVGSFDLYPFIDVDGDLLDEYDEVVVYHTNPFEADSDMDGLNDGEEVNTYSTDPLDEDSDDDGLLDGEEINTYSTDPLDEDSDDDGLLDGEEVNNYGTSPTNPDTDEDGHSDFEEIQAGTDPLDPDDYPKDAPVALILGLIFGLGVPIGIAVTLIVLARKGKIKLPFIKKK